MKNRKLLKTIQSRLEQKQALIQVIIGPRQVGKTTALKKALKNRGQYFSADYPTPLNSDIILDWWKQASLSEDKILAIDEIQKISNWSSVIKKLWDHDSSVKIILTGSSALLMEKNLIESLAGRFELIRAEHWNFSEAKNIFNLTLKDYIEYGCYPGSIPFLEDKERWANYIRDSIVEPAIGRDLLQLQSVEKPALLRQLFGVALSLPAQIISLQKLQGQLQNKGAIATLQFYLKLLSQAFLLTGVEKYTANLFRGKKSSPKLIIHDNALLKAFSRQVNKKISSDLLGRYLENAVGARFIEAGWNTFYWKDRKHEVDFIVIGLNNEKWAIEVKSTHCKEKDLAGLKEFCKIHPEFSPKLISLIEQKIDGIDSLKVEEVLGFCKAY